MIVFFHGSCLDGTASASAILKKFPDAELYPINHSYDQKELEFLFTKKSEKIFVLDFSFRKDDFEKLLKTDNDFIHIDHHISILKDTEIFKKYNNYTLIFDNQHAGCYLTWKYVHNHIPELIYYIEDRDIWTKKFEKTDAICSYLFSKVLNKPDELLTYFEKDKDIEEIYNEGKKIIDIHKMNQDRIMEKTEICWLNIGNFLKKKLIPAINSNLYVSEIGNELATKYGICCIFYISDSYVKLSFRSVEGSKIFAKDVAELFGGGGHLHAAAAKIHLKKFIKMIFF